MIYLTTGANGAGKTLITLKDVREQQLKEGRPVYYHGFDMDPEKASEFGWQPFDPKDWQSLPDGSICIMDECQNEFPVRRSGSEVPDYINAIAQHRRRRGFDFWLICPHPSLIDVFIRRLIGKPSFHRHLIRAFGADMVSVRTFDAADMKCEEPGAGARAQVTMRAYPKDVFSWYRSASLHTGKRSIPKQVYVIAAAVICVPLLFWFGYRSVYTNVTKGQAQPVETKQQPAQKPALLVDADNKINKLDISNDYLSARMPRVPDFPHTAPAYDQVTQPSVAPYPAACVKMGDRCDCYTQQATIMMVAYKTCIQIVERGFFVDWQQQATAARQQQQPQQLAQQEQQQPQVVPLPQGWGNPRAEMRSAPVLPPGSPVHPDTSPDYSWPKNPALRNAAQAS